MERQYLISEQGRGGRGRGGEGHSLSGHGGETVPDDAPVQSVKEVPRHSPAPATHSIVCMRIGGLRGHPRPTMACVFVQEGGTVTPGNASPMSDGAAALVLASRAAARRMGLPVLAIIRSQADANQAPEWCAGRSGGGVWRDCEIQGGGHG